MLWKQANKLNDAQVFEEAAGEPQAAKDKVSRLERNLAQAQKERQVSILDVSCATMKCMLAWQLGFTYGKGLHTSTVTASSNRSKVQLLLLLQLTTAVLQRSLFVCIFGSETIHAHMTLFTIVSWILTSYTEARLSATLTVFGCVTVRHAAGQGCSGRGPG